jgi:DsbC/DsbD-like thiol-disulfide interchange protein
MIKTIAWLRLAGAGYLLLSGMLLLSGKGAVWAADESRWDGDARSSMRLIVGSTAAPPLRAATAAPKQSASRDNAPGMVPRESAGRENAVSGALRAGVEIKLQRGWHTYWRYPGDSGVPPQFDFAQSQNVRSVEVQWPAPQRLSEAGGTSIGYIGNVIFPLKVTPADPSKPVLVRVKLDYAICEKLCVPAEGRAELSLGRGRSSQDAPLVEAEQRIPQKLSLGQPPSQGPKLAVHSVRRESGTTRPQVVVDVLAPEGDTIDLFAEGPTPQWALPVPEPVRDAPSGVRRFSFEIDGVPPGESEKGAMLTLTVVGPKQAIEVQAKLD